VIAATPWSPLWQGLLEGIGWLVAQIYSLIPNYGVTIIVLTVLIRLVLLPLGVKQIRSMQSMQAIQPKVKQLQQKYKGNKQKQQEEVMKLYKEHGVNPFSGCWPVLLQFPILIAMYSVLRYPQHPIHIPSDSKLYQAVIVNQVPIDPKTGNPAPQATAGDPSGTGFLGMNLLCSATQAGNASAQLADTHTIDGQKVLYPVDCGDKPVSRIPYYVFAVLMFGTTYYQQRQMQKASPPGSSSQQQQTMMKVMPFMFGVFGVFFPAGLVLYWTTSNAWQIGQQYFMLKNRPTAEMLAAKAGERKSDKKGFMSSMMERAEEERRRREAGTTKRPASKRPPPKRAGGGAKPGSGRKPPQGKGKSKKKPGSGGSGGGDPKKRPER
jgi:YidC/Oxa1 family membrane protein insertase